MWRNIASNAMTLIVVILFLIGGVMTLLKAQYYKPGPLTEAICLKVEPGSSTPTTLISPRALKLVVS